MHTTVVVVGVSGCSGSGKSSFARRLASHLDSPIIPFQQDWFFRDTDAEFEGADSWEQPSAIDEMAMLEALRRVRDGLEAYECRNLCRVAGGAQDDAGCTNTACVLCRFTGGSEKARSIHRPARRNGLHGTAERPVTFVVVEGYLLYCWPNVTAEFDVRICMTTREDVCCRRRYLRENGWDQVVLESSFQPNANGNTTYASDDAASRATHGQPYEYAVVKEAGVSPSTVEQSERFREYQAWYRSVVVKGFQQFWKQQLELANTVCTASDANPLVLEMANDDEGATFVAGRAQEAAAKIASHFQIKLSHTM